MSHFYQRRSTRLMFAPYPIWAIAVTLAAERLAGLQVERTRR
ncbi:MAG TPA: hypothetical protein VE338_21960 [Ktedonobacterales bacterium]|nr:hypothetical protein [Ktedonobacterales bacterium]